ncbi:MAG: SGNH/GDSL hydrolase family protein [Proteobacteria bacterium]|nr:SGNH/GDSL hydrolase family protein [Pseudomonadota bacterium]
MIPRVCFCLLIFTNIVLAQAPNPERGGERKKDPALASIEDVAGLPRVLLIGDSISIGYTLATRKALEGVANVHRIPANGSATDAAAKNLERWLAPDNSGKKWDVIHFNWGLHDLKHWRDNKLDLAGAQVNPLPDYEKNLREIIVKLKATGAKLIFATTTPVPEGSAGRIAKEELAYNEAAVRIMNENNVSVDDLHAIAAARPELQKKNNVHFSDEGYQVLATQVAAEIKKALEK